MSSENKEFIEKNAESIANWLESKKDEIPNVEKLIVKLRKNKGQEGHTVHAQIIKQIHNSNQFQITDVENNSGKYDVDIQLDNSINIQVQYGASVSWYNSEQGKVSELGGVENDWDKDKEVIFSKINQLPDTGTGIMFQFARGMGSVVLPEWVNKIPKNKVLVLSHLEQVGEKIVGVADIFYSDNFQDIELVKKVVESAGFIVRRC
jgi:hypothetical protein